MSTVGAEVLESFDCPICAELLTNPHALECGHSYCGPPNNCLQAIQQTSSSIIKCAVCSAECHKSISDLKPLYGIRDGIEGLSVSKRNESLPRCFTHSNQDGSLWCDECDFPICKICLDQDAHASHGFKKTQFVLREKVEPLIKRYKYLFSKKDEIQEAIDKHRIQLDDYEKAIARLKPKIELLIKAYEGIPKYFGEFAWKHLYSHGMSFEDIQNDGKFIDRLLKLPDFDNSWIENMVTTHLPFKTTITFEDIPNLKSRGPDSVHVLDTKYIRFHMNAEYSNQGPKSNLLLYLTWDRGIFEHSNFCDDYSNVRFNITLEDQRDCFKISRAFSYDLVGLTGSSKPYAFILWCKLLDSSNCWLSYPENGIDVTIQINFTSY